MQVPGGKTTDGRGVDQFKPLDESFKVMMGGQWAPFSGTQNGAYGGQLSLYCVSTKSFVHTVLQKIQDMGYLGVLEGDGLVGTPGDEGLPRAGVYLVSRLTPAGKKGE